jgi:DNA primase
MADNRRFDFQALKSHADFRTVLAHYALSPIGQGEQAKIHCPFHDDAKPSCSVNLGKGLWQCHTGCGSGNVLDFVHRMETRDGATVTLRQAGLTLAAISGERTDDGHATAHQSRQEGRTAAGKGKAAQTRTARPDAAPVAPAGRRGADDPGQAKTKPNKALGFALTLDPAHPYLKERDLTSGLVDTFGLGFCNRGSMAGRVCIPIHNAEGAVVAYAGRWVGSV